MPFGLKNAGATYQRLVNKIFKEQIGKTMEVYMDDMLVKALKRGDHIKNLVEAFSLLRYHQLSRQFSSTISSVETHYPKLEKLILALVVSARKLRPYYQGHRVIVMTDFPLRSIFRSLDASQQHMKWAIELSQFDLLYQPKTTIKAQALADFVAEFTASAEEEKLVNKKKGSSKAYGTCGSCT
ncbi:hypothetical protein L3X38_003961 [Prunus dulcis]|uniref:Reverse transcriptase domain-containing protein n=1 Tax=Prunus dulcis TaxID=3755 RepID=A0AAD4ZMZ2_PRUDU|nr:hypothetical protein L3X38_003961 [Prunus dulcis]